MNRPRVLLMIISALLTILDSGICEYSSVHHYSRWMTAIAGIGALASATFFVFVKALPKLTGPKT